MSADQILLVVISGLGVIHGLFIALFLWLYSKGHRLSNRILSILLLVLSFRVGKSVFLEFYTDLDTKIIFIGLGTLMAIGPLFFLFTKSCIHKDFRFTRVQLIHFVPSFLGITFGFLFQASFIELWPMLFFFLLFMGYYAHYLVYVIAAYRTFRKYKPRLSKSVYTLLQLIFYGLLLIWIAYFLNLFDEQVPYVVGPVLYSIVAYVISFIVLNKGFMESIHQTKYKTTSVSDEQMTLIFDKANKMIIEEEGYKDPSLTLKSLSKLLKVTPQMLSMVINQQSQSNFNNYINQFRVDESKKLLVDKSYANLTIAAIAIDAGFNSISSFNTAFKKLTGKTPQAYRKQLMK